MGRQWRSKADMCDSPAMSKQSDTSGNSSSVSSSLPPSHSYLGNQGNTGWTSSSFSMTGLGNLWKPSGNSIKVVEPKRGGGGQDDQPSEAESRQVFFDCAL